MKYLIVTYFILFPLLFQAQTNNDTTQYNFIELDDVVISAVKKGLDIQDLIEVMQFDSTLFIAFNNLYFTNYTYNNHAKAFNKKEAVIAEKRETVKQVYEDNCRQQFKEEEILKGQFLNRKKKPRFYTLELFDKTIYSPKRICGERRQKNWQAKFEKEKTQGHLSAIKQVIFNPGSPVKLPLIGDKFALFEEDMRRYYDFKIEHKTVNEEDCYVFSILLKPEFNNKRKEVVVRNLTTTFRADDLQIIDRSYTIKYWGALVKLEIDMEMVMQEIDDLFYPKLMNYRGIFKVPTIGSEDVYFRTDFFY